MNKINVSEPTEQQLKDPQWWKENVSNDYDYCYTTAPKWNGGKEFLGGFEFAGQGGATSEADEECLWLDETVGWVLHCKRPTEPAQYMPKVGEWCEYKSANEGWLKCFYVGIDDMGSNVFSAEGKIWTDKHFNGYRPIKSERDVFIEKAMKATNGDPEDQNLRDLFDDMFQANFKAPGTGNE